MAFGAAQSTGDAGATGLTGELVQQAAGCRMTRELSAALVNHLVEEFGSHGQRAATFLRTAEGLLGAEDKSPPRLGEAVSYCIREALRAILATAELMEHLSWSDASRAVTEARQRYNLARGLPGSDEQGALDALLNSINDLDQIHDQARIHERRLIAVLLARTGSQPLVGSSDPVADYQALMDDLNAYSHTDVDVATAAEAFDQAVDLLRRLFLPPEIRLVELDELAAEAAPTVGDVKRLLGLIATPAHLDYLFRRTRTARWLSLLDSTGMLDPPTTQATWPVYSLAMRHMDVGTTEVKAWLQIALKRFTASPQRTFHIARAALDLKADGHEILIEALRQHPQQIGMLVAMSLSDVDPSDQFVEDAADILLNPVDDSSQGSREQLILQRLAAGVTDDNWSRRLQLLKYKIRRLPKREPTFWVLGLGGSVADDNEYTRDRFGTLVAGTVGLLRRVIEAGIETQLILDAIDDLPDELRHRLRAWLMSQAVTDLQTVIDEVTEAIETRHPTGDDLPLIDRVVAQARDGLGLEPWTSALGTPPEPEVLGQLLAGHAIPVEWERARDWCALLPPDAIGHWSTAISLMAAALGRVTRDRLESRASIEMGWAGTPISVEQLEALGRDEAAELVAAWRPEDSTQFVSARELARSLQQVVKSNAGTWAADPLHVISRLRQPVYISHYFAGLAETDHDLAEFADQLVEAVAFCRTHPWKAIRLGDDSFDYDAHWRGVDRDGVELLGRLAEKASGYGSRADQAWHLLSSAARDRSDESSIVSPRDDPLQTAINRPCTSALSKAIAFMGHEHRTLGSIRNDAWELLDEALHLAGWDGAEHRAIIAPRLGFLHFVAAEWVEERRDLLIGAAAPEGLGQTTVDMAAKWGRPSHWVLDNARPQLIDAVRREVDNAAAAVALGLLWNRPGYELPNLLTELTNRGAHVVAAIGRALGQLLKNDDATTDHVNTGIAFWRATLDRKLSDAAPGFGWWSLVPHLDPVLWQELTLESVRLSGGRLDLTYQVAGRLSGLEPSVTALQLLNELIRGDIDEWDRYEVIRQALSVLKAAGDELRASESFRRLRTTLVERGHFEAGDP